MALECYFLKVVPSASETAPTKSMQAAFEQKSSKESPHTKILKCYKVVGEHTVIAVVQATSDGSADTFITNFTQDDPLIGQGRHLSVTCNQVISYEELDAERQKPREEEATSNHDLMDDASVDDGKDKVDSASIKSGGSVTSTKIEVDEGPSFWVEVETSGAGSNASMFSTFVKNDIAEATKKLASHGAHVTGFKVLGEKRFEYLISGVSLKDLETLMEGMPIMSMPGSVTHCRRIKPLKT